MKKSIVYLGVALVAFVNVSLASNSVQHSFANDKIIVSTYDSTPLNVAISKGDIETVKKFIEYGANVNETADGMSPLMTAARYNKVEILKILIEKGANVDAKDEKGYTALKYAELSNAKDVVAILKHA